MCESKSRGSSITREKVKQENGSFISPPKGSDFSEQKEYKQDFLEYKQGYTNQREIERRKIIDTLAGKADNQGKPLFSKKDGGTYFNRFRYCGGSGLSEYSSGNTLEVKYDLSNFKYIETKYKDCVILISLQTFDIDNNKKSKNIHLLYDRIGIIYDYDENSKIEVGNTLVSDAFLKMKITNYELPLSQKEREELVREIIEHVDKLKE